MSFQSASEAAGVAKSGMARVGRQFALDGRADAVIEFETPGAGHGEHGGIAGAQAVDGDWCTAGDGHGGRDGGRGEREQKRDEKASNHANLRVTGIRVGAGNHFFTAVAPGLRPCDLAPLPGRSLTLAVPDRTASVSERPAAKEQYLSVTALVVAVELDALDLAIGNHAAAQANGLSESLSSPLSLRPGIHRPSTNVPSSMEAMPAIGDPVFEENRMFTGPLEAAMYSSGPTAMKRAPARSASLAGAGGGAGAAAAPLGTGMGSLPLRA